MTGFGLLGHAQNLAEVQQKAVDLRIHTLPVIRGVPEVLAATGTSFKLMQGYSAETSGERAGFARRPVRTNAFERPRVWCLAPELRLTRHNRATNTYYVPASVVPCSKRWRMLPEHLWLYTFRFGALIRWIGNGEKSVGYLSVSTPNQILGGPEFESLRRQRFCLSEAS